MVLFIIAAILLVFSASIGYILYQYSQIKRSDTEKYIQAQSEINANKTAEFLNSSILSARSLANSLQGMKEGQLTDRNAVLAMMKGIALENKDFLGVWTCWEPNGFDGRDSEYINKEGHDNTGRFVPYWYRQGDNVNLVPCESYDVPGDGDYYQLALNSGEETILEPFEYEIDGKMVMMTSVAVPIKSGGKVVGVAGIDIGLDFLQEFSAKDKLYDTGYAALISNKGTILTHTKKEVTGKNITDIVKENIQPLMDSIQTGKEYDTLEYSTISGTKDYHSYHPIKIGNSSTPWSYLAVIPENEAMQEANRSLVTGLVFYGAGLLLLAFIIFMIANLIITPVKLCSEVMKSLSGGDFTARIPPKYMSGKDEVAVLASSVNIMTNSVRNMIGSVIEEATEVRKALVQMTTNISGIDSQIGEVSATTEEISAGMEESAASTQEMNAATHEIELSISSIASRAQEGAEKAAEISKRAEAVKTGFKESQQKALVLFEENKEQLQKAIHDSKAVEQITTLSEAIMQITSQTNLLSLNAAIEAARAGEAGKGFAVVAEEIRKLADSSKETVTEIQRITKTVIGSVENLSQSSDNLLRFVAEDVLDDFNSMLDTVQQYSEDADYMDELVMDFSATSEELLATVSNMAKAINEVTSAANEGAQGTGTIAESVSDIAVNSRNVIGITESTRVSSEKLLQLASKFKVQ